MRVIHLNPGHPAAVIDIHDSPEGDLAALVQGSFEMIPLHDNPDAVMLANEHSEYLGMPENAPANKTVEHYQHGFAATGGAVRGPAVILGLRPDGDFDDIPPAIEQRILTILA